MKTGIIVKFTIAGLHHWLECPIEDVKYLRDKHRHLFYFTCKAVVNHSDRDIEIICFSNKIQQYLLNKYKGDKPECDFGAMSCEMLAEEVATKFNCTYVECLEDDENGGFVEHDNNVVDKNKQEDFNTQSKELVKALAWWSNLPMQNLEDVSDSWAGYCMKYYPNETHCGNLSKRQIFYIWQQECLKHLRLEKNEANGYILVATIKGGELYKKKNQAGGWSYYGESCDLFGIIWDECLSNKEEFLAIAKDCYNLELTK